MNAPLHPPMPNGERLIPAAPGISDDQNRQHGLKAAAADRKSNVGPFVLCGFMLCIFLNCLGYIYNETRDFWTQIHVTSFKQALVHDYRDDEAAPVSLTTAPAQVVMPTAAQAEPVPALPQSDWHRVASGSDVDELRVALRLAYMGPAGKEAETWSNPQTGHAGMVKPVDMRPAAGAAPCRRFRITRQSGDMTVADTVDFCADGSIRQANP